MTCRRVLNSTSLRCFPIPRAASIWAMCAIIRWATWWPGSSGRRGSACFIPWVGTPLACQPKTQPSKTRCPRANGPVTTSRACATSSNPWGCPTTGRGKSPPAILVITGLNRKCFSIFSREASPIARNPWSTGTPWTGRFSPTNRWWMDAGGVQARRWKGASSRSGFSALPISLMIFSIPWIH